MKTFASLLSRSSCFWPCSRNLLWHEWMKHSTGWQAPVLPYNLMISGISHQTLLYFSRKDTSRNNHIVKALEAAVSLPSPARQNAPLNQPYCCGFLASVVTRECDFMFRVSVECWPLWKDCGQPLCWWSLVSQGDTRWEPLLTICQCVSPKRLLLQNPMPFIWLDKQRRFSLIWVIMSFL